ncbi:MAG: mechanosensitive ion channel [Acidimicrobiales bacterium]
MKELWRVVVDVETVGGRLATTGVLVVAAWLLATIAGRLLAGRRRDPFDRYVARKIARYVVVVGLVIAVAAIWRPFAGRLGLVLGFVTAGLAFAMQEVIGALAGWVSIATSRLYRVGDRVDVGGVRGDVIDITPLRTKLMEMGSPEASTSWVHGRQLTGRIVSVTNKSVFTDPVFNYSTSFDFLWEELVIPIAYDQDWRQAEQLLSVAVSEVSAREDARRAVEQMRRSYPIPPTDLEPRVFVRATDNWIELAARFVVPVRAARGAKDEVSRRVIEGLQAAGIEVASATSTVTVRPPRSGGDG